MSCMQLEEQVAEVQKFYSTINDQVNDAKDKGREKHVIGTKRSQQGGSSREANSSNTMKEVMHQFSIIFHQASANTLQLFFVISDFNCGVKILQFTIMDLHRKLVIHHLNQYSFYWTYMN